MGGAHDTVRRALTCPMKDVMVQSRACLSEGIMKQDPAMFRIFEHILFARLVVAQQAEILKELAEEGCIDESELEHFSRNLVEPAQVALKKYTPSDHLLEQAGALHAGKHSMIMDAVIYF